ncbi:putative quinol monooxygenase [Dasania marina]|uniref:putative quinol monooxygenase n=1 Tax=Dasania marina TaxID=471499 RepID=UPI000370BE18|nr:putative quinol monooxygenase [Dasania marina]
MSALTIVATIKAKNQHIALLKSELEKLLVATRTEQGCINYNLHQDNQNPAHFFMYENWQNRAAWRAHKQAPHFEEFVTNTDGAVDAFIVNEMTKLA